MTRSTRSTASKASAKAARSPNAKAGSSKSKGSKTKPARKVVARDDSPEDDSAYESEAYVEEEEALSEVESINSDNLDDEPPPNKSQKRKRGANSSPKKSSPRKKNKKVDKDDEDDAQSEFELEEGQEIVGRVIEAPKTGRVAPGQISQNTFNFLTQLKKPECNDREWFKLHEPVYRLAEKEWKDFVENFTDVLVASDPQVPHLPPKDVVYRIYRDVRFSNDKTPYKTGFSASFSRSGRKGIFAKYHVSVRPGDTLIAAGAWCPGRNELTTIRNNLLRSSARFRQIISDPTFVGLFGEAQPHPKGLRQNIFGMDDELKVSPKGIDKNHKDIDILKCRSFVVVHRFTDKQVLQPDFKEELGRVAKIMRPFVHCINDLMTIQDEDSSDSDDDGGDDEETEE